MKTELKSVYCSRCGDEILPSEQSSPMDIICAFCEHILLEAQEICSQKNNQAANPPDMHYKFDTTCIRKVKDKGPYSE